MGLEGLAVLVAEDIRVVPTSGKRVVVEVAARLAVEHSVVAACWVVGQVREVHLMVPRHRC